MDHPQLPEDFSADYENIAVREALEALQRTPDYEHLAAFLNALREGFLVLDVTGTAGKKKGPRVRTTRSTKGQLVLPLFTSMDEVRAAVESGGRKNGPGKQSDAKGLINPAKTALGLITSDRFVAAEINPGTHALVILRKYIALAASDDEITAESVEAMK